MRFVSSDEVSLIDYLNDVLGMNIDKAYLPRNISCPLHTDKKPSLRLYSPENRDGYCFSCGKYYSAITIHQAMTGCNVYEANKYIAETFNIDISSDDKESGSFNSNIELLIAVRQNVELIRTKPNIHKNFRILEKKAFYDFKQGVINRLIIKQDKQEVKNEN